MMKSNSLHTTFELKMLLAACFGTKPDKLNYNLSSDRLQRLLSYHGIRPQFLSFIHQNNLDCNFRASLAEVCQNIAINNLLSVRQQAQVNSILDQKGIECYAYKGSLWADWLYGDVGKREFGDIDILIKPEQFEAALRALKDMGYNPDDYREFLLQETERKAGFFRTDYHIPLENTNSNVSSIVEAHWQIAYPRLCFDFSGSEWSQYRHVYKLHNAHLNGFQNEYQFLLLLVHHGGKEQWSRIKYIADFAAYMMRHGSSTNWKLVAELAKSKGIFKLFETSLGLLRSLGIPWSKEWPENIIPTDPSQFIKTWESMPVQATNSTWPYFIHGLSIHDGVKNKVKILFAHLKYLTEFRLLVTKMKWYSKHKT